MGKKAARPKGCSGRKGKKTTVGDRIDLERQDVSHGPRQGGGEGFVGARAELRQD